MMDGRKEASVPERDTHTENDELWSLMFRKKREDMSVWVDGDVFAVGWMAEW